jgi:hypothetical protein
MPLIVNIPLPIYEFWTSICPLIRKITNLFRHTNIGIAFRNTNAMYDILKPKIHVTKRVRTAWYLRANIFYT